MDAKGIFDRFLARPGSEHIASEFALAGLAYWLNRQRPRRILEVGAGIGCLSEVIGRWMASDFAAFAETEAVCVEDDPWCQTQWRENLKCLPPGMRLADKVPIHEYWDFVILDGPQIRPEDWAVLTPGATVFIEGGRRAQRTALETFLRLGDESSGRSARPFVRAQFRPPDRTKGFSAIRLDPTRGERLWFSAVNTREWLLDLPLRLVGQPLGKRRS